MKKLLLATAIVAIASPAFADVGVSVNIGQPNFYGRIDLTGAPPPRLVSRRPVLIGERVETEPVYLRVPYDHRRHWRNYCGQYQACGRPVYFVDDRWYHNTYAPYYRGRHPYHNDHDGRDSDRDGRDHDGPTDRR